MPRLRSLRTSLDSGTNGGSVQARPSESGPTPQGARMRAGRGFGEPPCRAAPGQDPLHWVKRSCPTRVDANPSEEGRVAEWLQHATPRTVGEVDVADGPVVELRRRPRTARGIARANPHRALQSVVPRPNTSPADTRIGPGGNRVRTCTGAAACCPGARNSHPLTHGSCREKPRVCRASLS